MKVLFINTSESRGGAARAAMRIMNGVQQLGVNASMLVKFRSSTDPDVIDIASLLPQNVIFRFWDWVALKIKNKLQHLKWRPYRKTRSSLYLSDLRSMSFHGRVDWNDYDVIHLHWINQRFLDLGVLKNIKKPIVWTLHDCWPFCGICHLSMDCQKYKSHCGACPMLGSMKQKDLSYKVFQEKKNYFEGLDLHVVTPSNWLADCAKQSELFKVFPVTVIPNCIDVDLYAPMDRDEARKRLGLDPGKKYILFGAVNATNDPNKGFDRLVASVSAMRNVERVELLIFGADASFDATVLPIHSTIWSEIKDDKQIVDLYNAADVTVVPSRSENLSNTIMESLSCGTPVVAFNIGGNSDMVDHRSNGWLAEDICDMTEGIHYCLDDDNVDCLAMNARAKVMANYTIDNVSREYSDLYGSIV